MSILRFFLCSLLAMFLFPASAWALLDRDFLPFETKNIQIILPGTPWFTQVQGNYPLLAKMFLRQDVFKYSPPLTVTHRSTQCDPDQYRKEFLQLPPNLKAQRDYLQDYLNRCKEVLETGSKAFVTNAYKTFMLKLDPSQHPQARHVMFELPNGVHVKGFFAWKGDEKKRPLVIFRAGLFSNSQEFFPERFLFIQLFEQSDYNFLLLESTTGPEYLRNNQKISMGGFDEGIQNIQIAKMIRRAPGAWRKIVSDIHMVALSMGGHGLFVAAMLNELNGAPFKKFLGLCPLVNFQQTFQAHQKSGYFMKPLNFWASYRLDFLKDRVQGLHKWTFIDQVLNYQVQTYQGPASWDADIILPAWVKSRKNDFWYVNDFWPHYSSGKSPVLVLATKKDPIVPFELNAQRILEGTQPGNLSQTQVVTFEQGYHCSLPGAYDWNQTATILQSYLDAKTEVEMKK